MENTNTCVTCGAAMAVGDHFCANCGQKRTSRLTIKRLLAQLWSVVTNFEKGMWHTAEMLFLNPGKVVMDYAAGRTKPYYHPFRYAFLWAAISAFFMVSSGLFDLQQAGIQQSINPDASAEAIAFQTKVNAAVREYISLIQLLILPFFMLSSFWFFRKRGYNKAEHLVAVSYIQGHMALIGLFLLPIYWSFPDFIGIAMFIGMGIMMLYYGYLYRMWFKLPWWRAILSGILVYLIGYFMFLLSCLLIGFVLAIITIALK